VSSITFQRADSFMCFPPPSESFAVQ